LITVEVKKVDRVALTFNSHIMAPKLCALCSNARAMIKRPKTGQQICKECFFFVFETEVHNTITEAKLFKRGDRVAIGASGGKGAPSHLDIIQWMLTQFEIPLSLHML
jgi:cytoplasmic tRNA 2-thiolation protein 1